MLGRRIKKRAKFQHFERTSNFVSKISLNKPKVIFFGILVVLAGLIFLFFASPVFVVKSVEIAYRGQGCVSEAELQNSLTRFKKNIFFISTAEIEASLKQNFYCLNTVLVKKNLPDKLKVEVSSRQVALAIQLLRRPDDLLKKEIITRQVEASMAGQATSSATVLQKLNFDINYASVSAKVLVDSSGFIFSQADSQEINNVPSVVGYFNSSNLGSQIDPILIKNGLEVFNKLQLLSLKIKSAKIAEEKYLLLNCAQSDDRSLLLAFSLKNDISRQLGSLQLILEKATMDSKQIESIDVRFDKPVVVYSPLKKKK